MEQEINVDSLWLIKERDKSGKHSNIYHGNFIPQIPNQLIRRYTKENDLIMEPFAGSGTTLFECESLNRRYIGFDINEQIISYVKERMKGSSYSNYYLACADMLNKEQVKKEMCYSLKTLYSENVQFMLVHPPYMDIVKFTDKENDLSNCYDLKSFIDKLHLVFTNILSFLEKNKYFALVMGDIYKNREVIPLSFYCMDMIKRSFNVKLKGIIVKNIEGNRGKLGVNSIWKYRALKSDYFLFKHEYIFVFKKEF